MSSKAKVGTTGRCDRLLAAVAALAKGLNLGGKGHRKAAVAVAREFAVVLHSIRRDGTVFDPKIEGVA